MNFKTPNPASLGLAGFALTTWLLSMINAGWFTSDSMGMVLAVAFTFGGTAQALAGLMEIPRGNTFGATAFLSYGAFWWSLALFVLFLHDKVPTAFIGWYLFLWGVFTLYMWVATWRSARAATGVLRPLDHLLRAGRKRMDRSRMAASRGWLLRSRHSRAGVLSVRRRNHQRDAWAQRTACGDSRRGDWRVGIG